MNHKDRRLLSLHQATSSPSRSPLAHTLRFFEGVRVIYTAYNVCYRRSLALMEVGLASVPTMIGRSGLQGQAANLHGLTVGGHSRVWIGHVASFVVKRKALAGDYASGNKDKSRT